MPAVDRIEVAHIVAEASVVEASVAVDDVRRKDLVVEAHESNLHQKDAMVLQCEVAQLVPAVVPTRHVGFLHGLASTEQDLGKKS